MRVKLATSSPLPTLKAWFSLQSLPATATILDFKSQICSDVQVLRGLEKQDITLLLDDFQLLDEGPIHIIRDGDLICIRRAASLDQSSREKEATKEKEGGDGEQGPKSGKATPVSPVSDAASKSALDRSDAVVSPVDSTGARTPTSRKPHRNPWTLSVRMINPAAQNELRDFFGEAASGIIRINYPSTFQGRAQRIAYVEFGDEDAMKFALEKHGSLLNDGVPEMRQASDRETRDGNAGGFRGGGRGPGSGRGGFFSKGFAAAELTGQLGGKPNGDAHIL